MKKIWVAIILSLILMSSNKLILSLGSNLEIKLLLIFFKLELNSLIKFFSSLILITFLFSFISTFSPIIFSNLSIFFNNNLLLLFWLIISCSNSFIFEFNILHLFNGELFLVKSSNVCDSYYTN